MLLLKLCILSVLALIFVQDIKSKSVYWLLFPILVLLSLLIRLEQHQFTDIDQSILVNISFLLFQFLIVSVYFSIKSKRLINITREFIGLGDLLFLLSIAFYLSIINFLFFYLASLILILFGWLIWMVFSKEKNKHIPLAGLQAMMFSLLLVIDWWCVPINITNDNWLFHFVTK